MEKLIEREHATRNPLVAAPALAVQFFLIPLAVVGITVTIYVGFRSLVTEQRTAQDYLAEVRTGGTDRQWPAAYELSKLMADPKVRGDRALATALVQAYEDEVRIHEESLKANSPDRDSDPRVRQYLALAIGQLEPLSDEAAKALTDALNDPDSEARISAIWALGSSGNPAMVDKVKPLYASDDAGIRKMVVYALGALPGDSQIDTLRTALQDSTADVRWNAAVALARHGNNAGVPVLKEMLDRSYVQQAVKREVRQDEDQDPIADVMITGIRAAAALKDETLRPSVEGLSRQDSSMKVRAAAIEALKAIG